MPCHAMIVPSLPAEVWALGAALLQLPVHDLASQRHVPLAVQQLLLRGLLVPDTLPHTLHALADLAGVLELQVRIVCVCVCVCDSS
jgi:hypothetical protein